MGLRKKGESSCCCSWNYIGSYDNGNEIFISSRYRLSFGCNDKLQLGSVIASFTRARSALVAAAT